jgi:DNA primase
MRYGEGLLEEIRGRTDLVQLVGRRVKLVRKGRVMWGCCPFHQEKSPSFKVENERRLYKCFGCGKGGDAFKWLMETEGLTFRKAWRSWRRKLGWNCPNGRRKTKSGNRRKNRSTTSWSWQRSFTKASSSNLRGVRRATISRAAVWMALPPSSSAWVMRQVAMAP